MVVQTLTLKGERYVVMREKDYRQLMKKVDKPKRRISKQDMGDIAEAKRRGNEPSVPLEQVRRRLGI